jgi:hypothetical protein
MGLGEENTKVQALAQVTKYCIDIVVYYEIYALMLHVLVRYRIGKWSEI